MTLSTFITILDMVTVDCKVFFHALTSVASVSFCSLEFVQKQTFFTLLLVMLTLNGLSIVQQVKAYDVMNVAFLTLLSFL